MHSSTSFVPRADEMSVRCRPQSTDVRARGLRQGRKTACLRSPEAWAYLGVWQRLKSYIWRAKLL